MGRPEQLRWMFRKRHGVRLNFLFRLLPIADNRDFSHDCAAIAHARSVECVAGRCKVRLCNEGYAVTPQHDACASVRGNNREAST